MTADGNHNRLEVITMILHSVVLVTVAGLVAADFDPDLHAKYLTMPKSSFVEYFNAQNYSWKMAEYENIQDKYMSCAHFDMKSFETLPLLTHDLTAINLPVNFDARVNWPECETINEIYNQGSCGSCWTFGAATTASDRMCIQKNIHVRLSQQDFQCLKQDVCGGGNSYDAFVYWQNMGLVTEECKPYDIKKLYKKECKTKCVNDNIDYEEDKHFAEMVYRVSSESNQIKAELVKNGPIQVSFNVFADLKKYELGVYVHKLGVELGHHSVRLIGYGVEDGVDYWLAANSWGNVWGDNGYFKIKSYQEEVEFENRLMAGIPKN